MQLFMWPIYLSALGLLVNYFATPPTYLKPKVFVIGLSKTGTTSIGNALDFLGYKRIGWKDIRSRHLAHTYIHGDLKPLIGQTEYFDAFEDLPWPYVYQGMAERYPDAKFVLSLRKDEKTWLESMRRHMGRGTWEPAAHFYGAEHVDGNEETVLNAYRNHTANVRRYFEDKPDRYVEMVVDDGDANWKTLCSVAQCPEGQIPSVSFPRSNTVADWHDGHPLANLHWLYGWTVTRIEELTEHAYYESKNPVLNLVLRKTWHVINISELAICEVYFKIAVKGQLPLGPTVELRQNFRQVRNFIGDIRQRVGLGGRDEL